MELDRLHVCAKGIEALIPCLPLDIHRSLLCLLNGTPLKR